MESSRIRAAIIMRRVRFTFFKVEIVFILFLVDGALGRSRHVTHSAARFMIVTSIVDHVPICVEKYELACVRLALNKLFVLGPLRELIHRVATHRTDELGTLCQRVIRRELACTRFDSAVANRLQVLQV